MTAVLCVPSLLAAWKLLQAIAGLGHKQQLLGVKSFALSDWIQE